MDNNDSTSQKTQGLQGPAELIREDVRRIAELLPALAAWLQASPYDGTLPAFVARLERERRAKEVRKQATDDQRHLMDRTKDVDDLICVYANNHGNHELPPVADALYEASVHLIQSDDATQTLVGYVLALDVFLASPGVIEQAVRNLRQALVNSDPELAMLDRTPARSAAELAGPRSVKIGETVFLLNPAGELAIDNRIPAAELTAGETHALLTFLRMPGVAEFIDQSEAERQAARWKDFQ